MKKTLKLLLFTKLLHGAFPLPAFGKLSLLLCLLSLLTVQNALATDRYVKAGGGCAGAPCYTTLAAAIAASSAGDVIHLESNISEGLVYVNQDITIDGHGFTLTSTSSISYGIEVAAAGVTIQNLTVFDATTFGILTNCGADNFALNTVTVTSCGGTGIALNGTDNVALTDIVSTNNTGNGISITDCNNVTLTNLTTSGNAFGGGFSAGVGIFSSGAFCPPAGTTNVVINGTSSIGEPIPVYEQATAGTITGTVIPAGVTTHFAGVAGTQKYYAANLANAYTLAASLIAAPYSVSAALVHVEQISTGNKYVNDLIAPAAPQTGTYTLSVNAAIAYAAPGKTVFIEDGAYSERVVVTKSITLDGQSKAGTLLDGTGLAGAGSGIALDPGITNVTIKDLTVRDFTGTNANSTAGVYAASGNNNLTVQNVDIADNPLCSGFYANGPVDMILLDDVKSHGHVNGARGIVIWNGLKSNITIQNCEVYGNNCCGIELQDGTASGVTMSNNNVHDNWDNGMSAVGLNAGVGANTISGNTVTNNGRFGIEIKNPDGNGSNITLSGNIVSLTGSFVAARPTEERDLAGIAVFRRAFILANGNVDVPTGVSVTGNTVTGYVQDNGASTSEGFGIVVEGTNHTVTGNTVNGCDVGIQQQAGHLPYTANVSTDGDQSDLADQYFGRGNAPVACGNDISGNTLSGNGANTRNVPVSIASGGSVYNTNSGEYFCTIQSAVNDAQTLNTHTLEVSPGTFNEQVLVNKSLTIKGIGMTKPVVNFTGTPGLAGGVLTVFQVTAPAVTIENLEFQVDLAKVHSAILASAADVDGLTVKNNDIKPYRTAALVSSFGNRNAISINYGGPTDYRVNGSTPSNLLIQGNTVTYNDNSTPMNGADDAGFRAGVATDEGGGTFTANTFQTINQDLIIRFASSGAVSITNNNFNGGGVEVTEHNAGAGNITITGNTFDGAFANVAVTPRTAVLRLKNNQQNKTTTVSGNTFNNQQWAVSLENYKNVTLDNNDFTPLAGSTDFLHIGVNTKLINSNSNSIVQTTVDGIFTNNVFNGSGTAGGTGIGFYNHDNDNASFGTFAIGTAGNANDFNAQIAQFIRLDNQTGSSDAATNPTDYPNGGGWTTTMACWNQDYDVRNNRYDVGSGLQLPSAMNFAQRTALETFLFHKPDAACTGRLISIYPVHNLTQNTYYLTIQGAVTAANPNDVIECAEYTYNEKVVIDKSLTLQGVNEANCIIDGAGLGTGSGIYINNGVTNVTVSYFTIKNHAGTGPNSYAGVFGAGGNNNLTVQHCTIRDNIGGSGFFTSGPVNTVLLDDLDVSGHTNAFGVARGIVIWDGLKQNITITNCDVYNNNCCGIELQDGTATDVDISNNNVHDNWDNGIGTIGLNGSAGANTISGNTVTNNGRFGIEIKNPDGNGSNITLSGNIVSLTGSFVAARPTEERDLAGIAVFRRAFNLAYGNVDIPTGVSVTGNTVTGYLQDNGASTSEGFGIVVEGTNHTVTGNTVSGCDVGIQQQAGHLPYVANTSTDGDQSDLADQYFGRGNAPVACGNDISGNTLSGNGANSRDVGSIGGAGFVANTNTGETFCTIQAAINDAQTLNTHALSVSAGTFNEDVSVSKQLTITGAGIDVSTVSGPIGGSGTTFQINTAGVVIDGFTITRAGNNLADWNNPGLNSAGLAVQGLTNTVEVRNSKFIGNRTGIDINNSNGNNIHNNIITDNRTGLIFRNQTDNTNLSENKITGNWTVGVLFLDASGGTNSPVQTAAAGTFNENDLSGNWYGQIVDRQTGGLLPLPGSNVKNFECNWYGTTTPVVSAANSAEPGYAALIPVAYGGAAVPPGGQPDILGPASANFDYVSWLVDGTDNDGLETGFQPVPGSCSGTPVVIVSAVPSSASCAGSGFITVTFNGGSAPYDIAWTGGSAPGISSPYVISGLAGGAYGITVTDDNGSSATANAVVTVLPVPVPLISGSNTVCPGATLLLTGTPGVILPATLQSFAWTSQNNPVATVNGSGLVSGVTAGMATIVYTVTDNNGCSSSATSVVTVLSCTYFSGNIKWEHDGVSGVNNATVNLTGAATGIDLTDLNGDYLISLPSNIMGNFTLKPVKSINKLNGLTTADVTAIQQHAGNLSLLPAPFKRIAADVNKSNTITSFDASLVNQALLGNLSALNQMTSWRFVPASYVFMNPNVPWGFPEQIVLTGVGGGISGLDFKGVKLGDVVATFANPANFGAGDPLVWRVQDRVLEPGAEVVAEFYADPLNDLTSFQFALRFDPQQLQLVEIEPLTTLPITPENFGTYNLAEGEIRMAWARSAAMLLSETTPVFRLRFTATAGGAKLSDVLQLDDDVLAGHVYNGALAESDVELEFYELTGAGPNPAATSYRLLQNTPNPFDDKTSVGFVLPDACDATLRVFDTGGRLLYEHTSFYAAGKHAVELDLGKEGVSGILYYELTTSFGVLARKMMSAGK